MTYLLISGTTLRVILEPRSKLVLTIRLTQLQVIVHYNELTLCLIVNYLYRLERGDWCGSPVHEVTDLIRIQGKKVVHRSIQPLTPSLQINERARKSFQSGQGDYEFLVEVADHKTSGVCDHTETVFVGCWKDSSCRETYSLGRFGNWSDSVFQSQEQRHMGLAIKRFDGESCDNSSIINR